MSAKQMLFVVDHDKQLLSAMEMIFAQFYELECFTSATACLQRVAEKTPDLFMLAVDLPNMGTIAEYKSRAAFNFERVSVLVNNMPTHDTDLCGRLRDHLAISVETADAKILAMATQQENHETRNEISTLVADLGQHIHQFRDKYEKARLLGADKTQQMLTDLNSEFANLGMREVQEDSIKGLVQTRADELIEIFDFSAETEETLNRLSNRLDNAISKSA